MNLLRKLWSHRFFVSVAISETSAVRGMRIRAFWVASCCFLFILSISSLLLIGDLGRARLAATVSGNDDLKKYLDQIADLTAENAYQEEQVKTIAQELGLLQARLERFDALGEQLFSDDTFKVSMNNEGGKGGPETVDFEETPSLSKIQQQLGFLLFKADKTEEAITTGIAISTKEAHAKDAPYFWPVMDPRMFVSSGYAWRTHPITKKRHLHGGLDVAAGYNAPIVAASDGVVVYSGYRYGYGILVEIRHTNGFSTRYAHMNEATVKNGATVKAGDLVGLMGSTGRSTGPHLHFELLKDDEKLNPYPFVKDTQKQVKKLAQEGQGKALVAVYKAMKEQEKTALNQETNEKKSGS